MAVLEKRIGMQLLDCDAYVNIAGGIRIIFPLQKKLWNGP